MKISEIAPLITACQEANDSLLMTGVHGIGKSDVVEDWAEEHNVHLEILFLSNQEVGDLIGVPHNVVKDGKTIEEWSVPSWLDRMNIASENGQKTALFLDEISRAPSDVKQAALQLVLAGKIHEHSLPRQKKQKTVIIAADNPDNGNYQVEPMDPALLDRFLNVNVDVDPEAWLDWARVKNVNKIVRSFIADNHTKLHFMPDQGDVGDKTSATPRSWAKLGTYVDNFHNTPSELHYSIIAGKVGTAFARQFLSYIDNYQSIISVEDIETLTNDLKEKTSNIEKIGQGVHELVKDSESIQLQEITLALISKYIDGTADEAYPLMAMLYALHIEILVSTFRKLAKESPSNYKKLVDFDIEINDKKLFIRAASAVVV